MELKKIIKQYIILTTTLFIVLLQPLHSFQHYYNEVLSTCDSHDHEHHLDNDAQTNEDDCSICNFTYQPYLDTPLFSFETVSFFEILKPSVFSASTYDFQSIIFSYLRGPPVF